MTQFCVEHYSIVVPSEVASFQILIVIYVSHYSMVHFRIVRRREINYWGVKMCGQISNIVLGGSGNDLSMEYGKQ